jgi:uncharacterized protein
MIFVDTWAWVALADKSNQFHAIAEKQHRMLVKHRRGYVTSDYVLGELIDYLYGAVPAAQGQAVVNEILGQAAAGRIQLVHSSRQQFDHAWEMRQKYQDKPDISFVDFTSMVVMQELNLAEVFTGDKHFVQVGLGFRPLP